MSETNRPKGEFWGGTKDGDESPPKGGWEMPGSLEKLSPRTGPCVENVPALAGVGPEAAPSSSIRLIRAKLEESTSGLEPLTCSLRVGLGQMHPVSPGVVTCCKSAIFVRMCRCHRPPYAVSCRPYCCHTAFLFNGHLPTEALQCGLDRRSELMSCRIGTTIESEYVTAVCTVIGPPISPVHDPH